MSAAEQPSNLVDFEKYQADKSLRDFMKLPLAGKIRSAWSGLLYLTALDRDTKTELAVGAAVLTVVAGAYGLEQYATSVRAEVSSADGHSVVVKPTDRPVTVFNSEKRNPDSIASILESDRPLSLWRANMESGGKHVSFNEALAPRAGIVISEEPVSLMRFPDLNSDPVQGMEALATGSVTGLYDKIVTVRNVEGEVTGIYALMPAMQVVIDGETTILFWGALPLQADGQSFIKELDPSAKVS